MVYLTIKELTSVADDTIMVVSSLSKDIQPQSDAIHRPNALRTLCRIIDVIYKI